MNEDRLNRAFRDIIERSPELTKLVADMNSSAHQRAIEAAKADPEKHKLCTVFEGSARYRYFPAGRNGRNQEIRFCYSVERNAAGYFLGWREVIGRKSGRRDQWHASKRKVDMTNRARRYADEAKAQ